MTEKLRILIITAPYGNGHFAVANGLIDEFKKYDNIEYSLYDLYTEDYPATTKFVKKFYFSTYKKGLQQQAYRFFYYGSDKLLDLKIAKPYLRFGIKKLVKKIEETKPHIILNTFPVNCTYNLIDEGINIPVYTVITDYFANSNWISKHTRLHFLAVNSVSMQLKQRGIKDHQYSVTGIPIKPIFYKEYSDEEIRNLKKKFNIDENKKVILLVAGAHGVVPNVNKIVNDITSEDNVQLIVVCGKNLRLYYRLNRRFFKHKNLVLFQFVDNMHELMRISDLMITKPGGITMTEAANIGIPVILYRPVYGQELENAIFFSSKRAATIALQEDELIYKALTILNDDELLNDMKNNIKKIAIKNSALLIIDRLIKDYQLFLEEENDN
ncbi:UDP-N-acetylglucosamine 2-epimerase [Mycoplasmatota bacterium]|nr:UDP-N-acetylglucosamine 2-epimerase [Mycoplasmatota bacterium]